MKPLFATALLLAMPAFAAKTPQPRTQWVSVQSTLTYHVSHPLHQVQGVSHAAKGEGICENGQCNFLIAAPVKSFNSGDSARDLHMLQVTRGGQFPMVIVRARFPSAEMASPTIYADLQVQFAGQTVHYTHEPFRRTSRGTELRITGTVPATCSDFKIKKPSLFTIQIKNQIPVSVDTTWRRKG